MHEVDPLVKELSNATRLESGVVGEGAPSQTFANYSSLLAKIATISPSDLMWLRSNGKPAARVYGAFLSSKKFPSLGTSAFLELLDDDTPIEYQTGCEVLPTSASAIARAVVATGKFFDFEGNANVGTGKPMYVSELSKAKYFADQVGGESGRHLEWLVFEAALQNAKSLNDNDLKQLAQAPSPAGRLYAAVLMQAKGTPKKEAFAPLLRDPTSVSYISGCKVSDFKIGDVAKQLLETGQFLNFKIGK